MKELSFVCLWIACSLQGSGQNLRDIILEPPDNGKILSAFLEQAEREFGVDFIADMDEMESYTITGIAGKTRLTDFLDDYLVNNTTYRYSDRVMFIIDKSNSDRYALKRENFLLASIPGDRTLTGRVTDGINGDPLIGAKVFLPGTNRTTATDVQGKFVIGPVTAGIVEVNIEYIGYEPNLYIIGLTSTGSLQELSISLLPESTELQSVTITADRVDENVTSRITGVENLSIASMKILPAFMGEIDPIRTLTTLPGVSTAGELASGFSVRGGELGQNLIMQDGAIIYNPSHLFGFFSAFNPDMVNNVTLYKGGGPANFGSRISSVLDVSLRNGDAGKHAISGGVGLVSSKLSLEGPLIRNRSSYLVGGRFSYANWLVRATDNISLKNSAANFHDFTGKVFFTVNDKNYVSLTGYHSFDNFKLATDSVFSWGTTNFSAKWDHTFNDRMSSALTVFNSNYQSAVLSTSEAEGFTYSNSIKNWGAKYDLTRTFGDDSKMVAGFEMVTTLLEPGKLVPNAGVENIQAEDMQNQRSVESSVYAQWEPYLSRKWNLSAGVRLSHFRRQGKEDIYTFNYANMDGRYPSVSDTIAYGNGSLIESFYGLEPRVALGYLLNESTSVKTSYYRGYQYLHLISNTTSTTPQDYWVSSGPHLKPQIGDQYTLGVFKNLKNNRYELSVEGFYKEIDNAVDYIEGADITLNPVLEAGLAQGAGLAYGVEFMLKRSTGRLNGWTAYTFSRSLRRFRNGDGKTAINGGEYYPSAFDQPHNLTLILNYHLGGRVFLSSNFNYITGRPITIPVSKFSYDVYLSVLNYSERNEYRIPDYHRLDLSLTIKDRPRNNKRFTSEWIISLFNVYGRRNTYSISFGRYGTASKLSVLGSVFPSVSYNFSF